MKQRETFSLRKVIEMTEECTSMCQEVFNKNERDDSRNPPLSSKRLAQNWNQSRNRKRKRLHDEKGYHRLNTGILVSNSSWTGQNHAIKDSIHR